MGLFRKANRRLGADATDNNTTTPSTTTPAHGQDAADPTAPEKQHTLPATAVSDGEADADDNDGGRLAAAVSMASSHHEYPTGLRLAFLLVSIFSSMFLVAIDRLIISTVRLPLLPPCVPSLPSIKVANRTI